MIWVGPCTMPSKVPGRMQMVLIFNFTTNQQLQVLQVNGSTNMQYPAIRIKTSQPTKSPSSLPTSMRLNTITGKNILKTISSISFNRETTNRTMIKTINSQPLPQSNL